MFHSNPLFRCYFGDNKDNLDPNEYLALTNVRDILSLDPFSRLKKIMGLEKLLFLKQTHSTLGYSLSNRKTITINPFAKEGDYLITNQKNVGIGVMTADCLPLIITDIKHNAIGIAHAGWRGTVASIATKMLNAMEKAYGSHAEDVTIFFGPHAKICCYQIQPTFTKELEHMPYAEELIVARNASLFFDVARCNRRELERAGVKKNAFQLEYAICTICSSQFHSHRNGSSKRQMTVVSLI